MIKDDPFNLQRFVAAQEPVYAAVLAELSAGRKTSHWMWFVFPQIAGLGLSAISREFSLSGRDEAVAYLEHPLLGPRLVECTELVKPNRGPDVAGDLRQSGRPQVLFLDDALRTHCYRALGLRSRAREGLRRLARSADARTTHAIASRRRSSKASLGADLWR